MQPLPLNPDDLQVDSFEPLSTARILPEPGYQTDGERLSICLRSCDTACLSA